MTPSPNTVDDDLLEILSSTSTSPGLPQNSEDVAIDLGKWSSKKKKISLYWMDFFLNSFTPKLQFPHHLTYNSYDTIFKEFDIWSINNPLIDNFLNSHHLSAWYCKDTFCLGHSLKLNGLTTYYVLLPKQGLCGQHLYVDCFKKELFQRAVLFLQSLHKLKAVTTCVPRSERKDSVTRTNIKNCLCLVIILWSKIV